MYSEQKMKDGESLFGIFKQRLPAEIRNGLGVQGRMGRLYLEFSNKIKAPRRNKEWDGCARNAEKVLSGT
jgi:hypothetical protein